MDLTGLKMQLLAKKTDDSCHRGLYLRETAGDDQ